MRRFKRGASQAQRKLEAWINEADREKILENLEKAGMDRKSFRHLRLVELRRRAVTEFLDAAGFTETVDD